MDHESQKTQMQFNKGPRACITCAKAKSRCIPGPTEKVCERCHRLHKPCSSQTPAPPRKRKTPKPTRVAELEKRLEDLTARVESRSTLPLSPDGDSSIESESRPRNITTLGDSIFPSNDVGCFTHLFAPDRQERQQEVRPNQRPRSEDNHSTSEDVTASQNSIDHNSRSDTEERPRKIPKHFPRFWKAVKPSSPISYMFVSEGEGGDNRSQNRELSHPTPSSSPQEQQGWNQIPDQGGSLARPSKPQGPWYYPTGGEAQQLLENYRNHMVPVFPFVVPPPNMTSDQLRKERPILWKAVMMQALYLDARRQIPLGNELLNDIVATAFLQPRKSFDLIQALEILIAWFHISIKSFQMTNLLFLMRSICVSLGINESQQAMNQQEHSSASIEQMRTYAGVYYLVTMIFTTNKKPDAFMNTSYLAHCCRILEEKMEYSTDNLAVALVRTQQLAQSISTTLAFRKNSLPLTIMITSFQHEIDQLRTTIPEALQHNLTLETQLHVVEILLYEAALQEESVARISPTERLRLLWKCLEVTRSMLEARFRKYDKEWPGFIALTSFDYTFAMLTCLKLEMLNLPGWDRRLVRQELKFDRYLTLQIQDLQDFTAKRSQTMIYKDGDKTKNGQPECIDPFMRLHQRLLELSVCVKAELAATIPPDPQGVDNADNEATDPTTASDATNEGVGVAMFAGPETRGDLDELIQGFQQSSWQDVYNDDGWETNFNSFMAGFDDISGPSYTEMASTAHFY